MTHDVIFWLLAYLTFFFFSGAPMNIEISDWHVLVLWILQAFVY